MCFASILSGLRSISQEIFEPTKQQFHGCFCFAMNECSFHWNNTYCRSFSKKCNRSLLEPMRVARMFTDIELYFPPLSFLSFILSIRFDTLSNCKLIILVKFHNISSIDIGMLTWTRQDENKDRRNSERSEPSSADDLIGSKLINFSKTSSKSKRNFCKIITAVMNINIFWRTLRLSIFITRFD